MDDFELLCIEDILEIHKEAIEQFGGSFEFSNSLRILSSESKAF
jgi:hypothetical protein